LGRPRFTQVELGVSYGQSTVIADLVQYDSLGRVAFSAAPFESAELPFVPESLATLPYGTTAVFDGRGRLVKTVDAEGWNETATDTSVAGKIHVVEYERSYE